MSGEYQAGGIEYEKPKGFTTNANGEITLDKNERKRYNKVIIGKKEGLVTVVRRRSK